MMEISQLWRVQWSVEGAPLELVIPTNEIKLIRKAGSVTGCRLVRFEAGGH